MSATPASHTSAPAILLLDGDVITRWGISEYLRACGFAVVEAATGEEAQAILQAGPKVDILFADAKASGGSGGFALAQWVRRNRPKMLVLLHASVAGKAQAASELCDRHSIKPKPCDHKAVADRIHARLANGPRRGAARGFLRAAGTRR